MDKSLITCSRRRLLALAGLSVTGGCTSLPGQEPSPPGLDSLYLRNQRTQEVEVAVAVERDSEIVYEQAHELAAWKSNTSFGELLIDEDWLGTQTPYEVIIDLADTETESYSTEDFLEIVGDTDGINCFGINVVIDSDFIDFRPSAQETCRQ